MGPPSETTPVNLSQPVPPFPSHKADMDLQRRLSITRVTIEERRHVWLRRAGGLSVEAMLVDALQKRSR